MPSPSSPPAEDPDKAFTLEHGRLRRSIEHHAFDPYRRPVLKVPLLVSITQPLVSLILVPVRFLLAILCIVLAYFFVLLFGPPVSAQSIATFSTSLLPSWRRRICTLATQLLARVLLFALGFWYIEGSDAEGYDHQQAQKATIISNHSSLADPCLLAYLYAPGFVAKSHVYKIPGIGRIGAAQHTFYIDRINGSGVSVTEKIVERQKLVRDSDVSLPPLCVFPEGTTTNGRHLLKFRTGAFVAGTPVAPVLIRYKYEWFSPTYETVRTVAYLIGILSQFANRVEYYRMPVYYPSEEERANPVLYASNVYQRMLETSENAWGHRFTPSRSGYVDKIEYHSLTRGTKLKPGLQLSMEE